MSQPGWYPDPGGSQGRFRYWNGATWSAETTVDPAHSPAPGGPGGPSGGGRGRGGLIVAISAVVVLALALWWFVLRPNGSTASAPEDTNTSKPSISAWNETSTPTPSPSSSASDPQPSNAQMIDCPYAAGSTVSHPNDGRLHGGHVSVEKLGSPWADDVSAAPHWVTDGHGQVRVIVQGWVSSSMVGGLNKADGFTSPQQAARAFLSCYATSSYYSGFTGRTDITSKAITIDGHNGWYLRSEVRVVFATDPTITGDVVDIIVLDTGDSAMFSFWEGNATIGDQPVQAQVDQVRGTLRVDG